MYNKHRVFDADDNYLDTETEVITRFRPIQTFAWPLAPASS